MGQVKLENGDYVFPKGFNKNIAAKYFAPNTLPGCLNMILGKKEIITDQEFNDFRDNKMKELTATALKKVDLNSSDLIKATNLVYAPLFDYLFTNDKETKELVLANCVKKGNDGIYRYGFFNVVFIFYSEKQLLTVNIKYDIVNEEVLKSSSEEYFYKDVVGVSADEESFCLKTTGGPAANVNFKPEGKNVYKFDVADSETVVSSVRKILREIKE
jgi:hypothetical protein